MPARQVKKRPRRKQAIGDFRDLVTPHRTASRPTRGGGVEKVFTPVGRRIYMKVETVGQNVHGFNSVNVDELPTHKFTTRWRADIDAELFLEFDGLYFEILDLENLEQRNEYLVLKCRQTGAVEKEASAA